MLRAFPNITDSPIAPLSSIGVDGSRPDADPPDPGRVVDLSIDVMSEMDVSDPVQTNKQPLAASRSPPSYKDTLMASTSHSPVTTDIFDDDEVVLLEGDVTRSDVDGLISIQFSDRPHPFRLMDIENDYFLASFWSRLDYDKAIIGGPWVIFGHYLVVEPWTVDFSSQPYPSRVMAWIRLSGLPITLYQRSIITVIGECIGSVIKLDYETACCRWGRFARMAISFGLRKLLVSKLFINGRLQDICPASTSLSDALQQLAPIEPVVPSMTESFGPWMMVKRRQCRTYRKDSSHQPGFVPPVVQESRFNPIFEEEPPVAPILPPATSTTVISLPASVPIEPVDSVTFDALSEEVVPSTHKGLIQAAATTKGKEPLPAVGPSSKPSSLSNRSGSTLSSACFALFPRLPLKFNRSKHTAIVISENANPNVPRDASIPIIFPPSEPPGGVQNVHVLSKSNAIVSSAEGVTSHAHATSVTIDSSVVGDVSPKSLMRGL
ncbi:hypothetical protein V6N12_058314 [Hibiscus sabdariffa]|uniref:DUF4283 domain-containing protein n=1 Tax=Hibiscus sabdariffa TaxID=183260 RepID=A0ABR2ERT0_9ROSI